MMVYPEEPSIWSIPHIPALYDDDGDYGGKKKLFKLKIAALIPRSASRFIQDWPVQWMNE